MADGVGGWINKGVEVMYFSREFCFLIKDLYFSQRRRGKKVFDIDFRELIVEAVKLTQSVGSSTIVMAAIDREEPLVQVLNLGDSGLMLLRREKGEVSKVFRTVEKQHYFNCPYQCGTNKKLPYNADLFVTPVQEGDLLILGSDGLFDNLFDDQIIACAESSSWEDVEKLSYCLAEKSLQFSFDRKWDCPFNVNARKDGAKRYMKRQGGKRDDITVIAAKVELDRIV